MKRTITALALTLTLLAPVASVGTPSGDTTDGSYTHSVSVSLPTQGGSSFLCRLFPSLPRCK